MESYSAARRSWQPREKHLWKSTPCMERKGKKGKDTDKGEHRGKQDSSRMFESCCGHCGSRDTSSGIVATRTLSLRWMTKPLLSDPNSSSNANSSTNRVPSPPLLSVQLVPPADNTGDDLNFDGRTCALWVALRTCHRCQQHEVVSERDCRASGGHRSN